jgi:DHA1 family bicyclomycin/chloramphenicol resistance-like MFS transporter
MAGLSALTMNIFLPSLPGMAAMVRGALWADAAIGGAVSGAVGGLQIVIGPISDRYGRRKVCWGRWCCSCSPPLGTLACAQRDGVPDLPHGAGGDRQRHGAVAGHRARHGRRCRGRLDDRLCHHGDEPGADDRPGDRRLLDEPFGWQANFRLLLVLGAWRSGAGLGRSGRNGGLREVSILDQMRPILPCCLAPVLGLHAVGGLRLGLFLRLSGRRALCRRPRSFGLSSSHVGMLFALTAIGYAAATSWPGGFRCGWG